MPNWPLFVVAVAVLTLALLVLSRLSARAITTGQSRTEGELGAVTAGSAVEGDASPTPPAPLPTGGALLANVAATHGLLALVTLAIVWVTGVPLPALGVTALTAAHVAVGLGLGVGLYLASETATAVGGRLGVEFDERLRGLLSPESHSQWAALLFVVLPIIVVAEELLFRGVLIGAMAAGVDVPVWALVLGASVLFGLGHSAQGGAGVAVTGALGLLLGVAFVWTGSLAVVAIAHYVVDVLEFVVHGALLDGRDGVGA